ncbi:DUF4145 domain-containing protein [Flavobacterium sp. AED]|uniref:DUF4145 domain-containing protein n=1 Tax=Flavobacterium sp. AED TaxID=1423323 RepID=UPI00057CD656|nr:DUF4145 domain-containing protein [Flavobacterium sp. AED]KIA85658.1 hypothetical protein OA85_10280 [Flavobacterium sp. AED]
MEEKYFCRNCKGLRNHQEIFKLKTKGDEGYGSFQWVEDYSIIKCMGCETVSFLKMYGDTSMIESDIHGNPDYFYENIIYPPYLEKSYEIGYKRYLPLSIRSIYSETISALKADLLILTAGGLRAIIEALCNHLKIRKDNLEERIDLLHKKGHLTLSESQRLHSVRFLGNDALHEMEKPKKEHLYILLDIVNHLLTNLLINDKMIKGKIDMMIETYDEFIKLVQNKVNKEMLGKELSLTQILDKSKRLIIKKNFPEFEQKIIDEIGNGTIDFMTVISADKEPIYQIIKQPEFTFNW